MIFLDIEERFFQIRNDNAQTYVIPYRAMVTVSKFRPDEDVNGAFPFVRVRNTGGIGTSPNATVDSVVFAAGDPDSSASSPYNFATGSFYIAQASTVIAEPGSLLIVDAPDDADITVMLMRLPDSL